MRSKVRTHMTPTTTVLEVQSVSESIRTITERKDDNIISVEVAYFDENNIAISTNGFSLVGNFYDLLMSESPEFAPGKPQNEYREVDLWYVIDLMETQAS